jgi:hypothetical protein
MKEELTDRAKTDSALAEELGVSPENVNQARILLGRPQEIINPISQTMDSSLVPQSGDGASKARE